MQITAIILSKNNEVQIAAAVQSVQFCEDILVIDDNSSDETARVAQNYGATVLEHPLDNNFAQQRNWAMSQAKTEWVLFLDSDEQISPELKAELQTFPFESMHHTAYSITREDIFMGKALKHGEVASAYHSGFIRLMKKETGTWVGPVHEQWISREGSTGSLKEPITHTPHPSIKEFLQKVNMYSTLRAKELYEDKKKFSVFDLVCYPAGKFLYTYFLRFGFLDGPEGFIYSFMMSFHSFLVRAKLYQYETGLH